MFEIWLTETRRMLFRGDVDAAEWVMAWAEARGFHPLCVFKR